MNDWKRCLASVEKTKVLFCLLHRHNIDIFVCYIGILLNTMVRNHKKYNGWEISWHPLLLVWSSNRVGMTFPIVYSSKSLTMTLKFINVIWFGFSYLYAMKLLTHKISQRLKKIRRWNLALDKSICYKPI